MIATETGGRIVVATIAKIVELKLATVGKYAIALRHSLENVFSFRVGSHPKEVHVAKAVARLTLVDHTGIIFYSHIAFKFLAMP